MNAEEAVRKLSGERELLRFTTAGSVDDGKSTLIGRMLYDCKSIFQDQLELLERSSKLRGEDSVNLALLTDGLRAEREQGITIDVAYRYFSTPHRKFIIADTPGHEQYTRNMVTGASSADLAIILIDARNGVAVQSKRHGIIASLLGIPHIVVAVNKMDLVDYSKERYREIVDEYTEFAEKLNFHDLTFIPISALQGDNVVMKSEEMPWYSGTTLLYHLENVVIATDRNLVDFRFPVQYVVRPDQNFRGFAGKITSGTIKKGDEILVLPSMKESRVKEIVAFKKELAEAFEGQSVILTLDDEVEAGRGTMIVSKESLPTVSTSLQATVSWMDDKKELCPGKSYLLRHTTNTVKAHIRSIEHRLDVNTLEKHEAAQLSLNEIGLIDIETSQPLYADLYSANRANGGFILLDMQTNITVAAGMIRSIQAEQSVSQQALQQKSTNVSFDHGELTLSQRCVRQGHKAAIVWLTGLSGSGKSAIAKSLELQLFNAGHNVVRLDGDNLRHGLCGDLGFSASDRAENIRRAGQVAKLMADTGAIVLASFISPFAKERRLVKTLAADTPFFEVFVDCPLEVCERRDPKGLYARVRSGDIKEFTGISSPYEKPVDADLTIENGAEDLETSVAALHFFLISQGIIE